MQSVKWGEYELNVLFGKIKTNSLDYKTADLPSVAEGEFNLPALTAGIQNQGLNNYVPRKNATILQNVISISANGANTGATFYQSKEFTVLQDAYAIKWIYSDDILTDRQYLFLTGCISKTIVGNYEWTNKAGWERIKTEKIQLPVKDGRIDFDFMESFIAELEARHIAELEAYLTVTGLKDYTLTKEEEKALKEYETLPFIDYPIVDIFNVKNTANILSSEIKENSGTTPYLCASADNNAVSSYISFDKKYLEEGKCVFIGGKTFVVSYQEKDFYSNDSHNLALYLKNENKTRLNQLYLAVCVYKSLRHKYSWGDSVSKTKIKSDYISLPTRNGEPDYAIMETFISAIQKLVIKDVVEFDNRKIDETKKLLQSND
ncbi:MAG: restriction endonuclease subunit S [Clostridia bacterium]|nr:restriction endonuclease subunit S [Clostridia bacterium]